MSAKLLDRLVKLKGRTFPALDLPRRARARRAGWRHRTRNLSGVAEANVSDRLTLHAGCLLELDLVARVDDEVVVCPGTVDRHDRIPGDV
jgi:hypothetical protein